MKTSNRFLPYPILSYGDDVLPALSRDNAVSVDVLDDAVNKRFIFNATLRYENESIQNLVAQGKAEYLCDVYCAETMLRRCEVSFEPKFEINLGKTEVNGRISFEFYIIAKEDIPEYRNTGFNEIYGDEPVPIEKGNILASFGEVTFNTRITKEKRWLINSFIMISNAKERPFNINLDNEKIMIELPETMFEQYSESIKPNRQYDQVVLSSLAMGALVHAILNMESHKGRSWCDAIETVCRNLGVDKDYNIDDPMEAFNIANLMLHEPYKRLFNDIVTKTDKALAEQSITTGGN